MKNLKEYKTKQGELLLFTGTPNFTILDDLVDGPGDLWHSSLDQGYKNAFQDIVYQTAVYWWYLNDFENVSTSISWRVNPESFVVRKSVWENLGGFDEMYESDSMKGLDLGYNLLRIQSGVPLYVKNLFKSEKNIISISKNDRYLFYRKHVKPHHSLYMMYRKGIFNSISEFRAYKFAKKNYRYKKVNSVSPRELKSIEGKPTVSLIIPTMRRQKYTQLLLEDHKNQTYTITQAVIVDATPESERDSKYYRQQDFNFKIDVKWQTSKGSCRARNEAIELCTGDYIIFADDDIRILPDFVENHIKLLQTYNADACNGLDIMAKTANQDLSDLKKKLIKLGKKRWKVGASQNFNNANSCVKKEWVTKITGNDINFDGGYGEDGDFGLTLLKSGAVVLYNPYSVNLHLKPPVGGYRWWGAQSKVLGKKRKKQPWELDKPVKFIRPVPSPTISYGILKHFTTKQVKEWRVKHFFLYLFKGSKKGFLLRLFKYPYKQIQFSESLKYAKRLIDLGVRYK
ncbi:glycosyltransferase family 2 protein [Lutibacter sp. B1]|uniref:glycosyltransferase family 2 protein n=1 Tax=Lutibacter sp. B1 TaxID=2725996 RepID=UPI001456E109|nr:glycosyltransferase [Lutibacter sp. B1]NLP58152.1 glycosyltransferase [Lutibacter sp. B1]